MPILTAGYSKKIGLPGYSSHSFSVTIQTEIVDVSQVEKESNQLYALLQETVDRNIQDEGFVPEALSNGSTAAPSQSNGNNGSGNYRNNGGSSSNGRSNGASGGYWKCSPKQRELIEKVIQDNQLDEREVEELSQDMFQKSPRALNKMECSGLIQELLNRYGDSKSNGNGNGYRNGSRNGGRSYQGNRR